MNAESLTGTTNLSIFSGGVQKENPIPSRGKNGIRHLRKGRKGIMTGPREDENKTSRRSGTFLHY
ncbi:hypothetical protein EG028_23675 [Chitinophaga barathri]|uniref:Uncharacterized protein n=1 Tax=Chitinophaga barathri TaxID=1647451 RepID=A0A3N4M650_9BACT|nr:hypothetical protein EG028_23675 [Chitinophaga barathri]